MRKENLLQRKKTTTDYKKFLDAIADEDKDSNDNPSGPTPAA